MRFRTRSAKLWRPRLLTLAELKNWLQRDLSQADKIMFVLAALDKPSLLGEVRRVAREAGLRGMERWNFSATLSRAKGLIISTPTGWELTEAGKTHLSSLALTSARSPSRAEIIEAADLLSKLSHSSFDRMLLEFGIDELKAGREVGGLQARANAVAKFAFANPAVKSAEGLPIGVAIIEYAKRGGLEDTETDGEEDPGSGQPKWHEGSVSLKNGKPFNPSSNKVFLVHGRDTGAMHEVARFLEKIGLEVTILHERPNKGRTLISKFQEESADIGYAVVLMTPDDVGGLKGHKPSDRARQNVVFELGFFIGRLGESNVCALVSRDVERPSDFEAVVYVEFDNGNWKTELARELREAGIRFDHSKVF